MFRLICATGGVLALTATAMAFDLAGVKTKVLYGLEGPSGGSKIANDVLADLPLETEGLENLAGRNLRTRFWTIEGDDGIVPIHDHANRPALFTILSGEIFEYNSQTPERILHTAGGLALEEGELAHWWLNEGEETVHLIAFDVHQSQKDAAAIEVSATPDLAAFEMPEAVDTTFELLGAVNIGAHFGFGSDIGRGQALSTYRATLAPGGVFPAFTAAGEPLQMFVWEGAVSEHRSDTTDPIAIAARAGSSLSVGQLAWWENTSDAPAVLYFGVVEPWSEVKDVPRTGPLAHGSHLK